MLDEDDRLALPEKREVVFLAVEKDVPECRDLDVFREYFDAGLDGLVELREFSAVVEELAEDGVIDLTIRHAVTSLYDSYFT